MNREEAIKKLEQGKIIRAKDTIYQIIEWKNGYYFTRFLPYNHEYRIPMIMSANLENFLKDFKETPVVWTNTEEWEEYIPLYDFCGDEFKASIISEKNRLIKDVKDKNIDPNQAKIFLSEYLTDIIYRQMKREPDQEVMNFIESFSLSNGIDNYNNAIYPLFASGYCYYFAKILEEAFKEYKKGKLCLCCPYGHIIWMYNNMPYDISGVSDAESNLYIPLDYLSEQDILNFKHIGKDKKLDAEYTSDVINLFCENFLREVGFGGIFEEVLEENENE